MNQIKHLLKILKSQSGISDCLSGRDPEEAEESPTVWRGPRGSPKKTEQPYTIRSP